MKRVKQARKSESNKELLELEAAIAKGWTCVRASKRYRAAIKTAKRAEVFPEVRAA